MAENWTPARLTAPTHYELSYRTLQRWTKALKKDKIKYMGRFYLDIYLEMGNADQ
jgi:hypothetical protein